jgi:hypothetical protein
MTYSWAYFGKISTKKYFGILYLLSREQEMVKKIISRYCPFAAVGVLWVPSVVVVSAVAGVPAIAIVIITTTVLVFSPFLGSWCCRRPLMVQLSLVLLSMLLLVLQLLLFWVLLTSLLSLYSLLLLYSLLMLMSLLLLVFFQHFYRPAIAGVPALAEVSAVFGIPAVIVIRAVIGVTTVVSYLLLPTILRG